MNKFSGNLSYVISTLLGFLLIYLSYIVFRDSIGIIFIPFLIFIFKYNLSIKKDGQLASIIQIYSVLFLISYMCIAIFNTTVNFFS